MPFTTAKWRSITEQRTQYNMHCKIWTVHRKKSQRSDEPLAIPTGKTHTTSVYRAAEGMTDMKVHNTAITAANFSIVGVFLCTAVLPPRLPTAYEAVAYMFNGNPNKAGVMNICHCISISSGENNPWSGHIWMHARLHAFSPLSRTKLEGHMSAAHFSSSSFSQLRGKAR